ncbi:MAG: CpaE family protein [Planctomycetaceae bacterium]
MQADVLILGADGGLQEELRAAAEFRGEVRPRLRFVADEHGLQAEVRSRPPGLVLVPLSLGVREVLRLSRELGAVVPAIPVVAVFRPGELMDGASESGVLIEAMRGGVRDFLRRPVSSAELRQLLSGSDTAGVVGGAAGVSAIAAGRVMCFISNKGGVGKSTLALNTAVSLSLRHPGRVLLIDASLQMGVAASLLNLQPERTLADVAGARERLDLTLLRQMAIEHSSGLHLLAAPVDAVAAMDVDDTLISRLILLARRAYDYVIVDTFPLFDRVVIAVLDLSDLVLVVMENVVPTLIGGAALLRVLEQIGVPPERQRLILNRQQDISGNLTIEDIAVRLNREVDYVFPWEKRLITAANLGEPAALRSPLFSGFAKTLQKLTADLESLSSESASGEQG